MEKTDMELRANILRTIKRLTAEGKDIFAGYFQAHEGNVILTASRSFAGTHVNYCCYNRMWDFVFDKTEFQTDAPFIIDPLNHIDNAKNS